MRSSEAQKFGGGRSDRRSEFDEFRIAFLAEEPFQQRKVQVWQICFARLLETQRGEEPRKSGRGVATTRRGSVCDSEDLGGLDATEGQALRVVEATTVEQLS